MNYRVFFRRLRQVSQVLFLLVFLFLFRQTDYAGSDTIPWAVNVFFRWDPLVAAAVTLAERTIIPLLLPALAVIALTLVFGRIFCGWICPLGTLLDGSARVIKPVKTVSAHWRRAKYVILIVVLVSAALGVQWVGFVDPFSILVRGLTVAVDPAVNELLTGVFDTVYFHAPGWVVAVSEAVYDLFKAGLLPYKQSWFLLPFLSFAILAGVFALELLGRRFWCRNLCPLGALLGLVSRLSFFRRVPLLACRGCQECRAKCRMNAFNEDNRMMAEECNLCLDCLEYCPQQITAFRFSRPVNKAPVDLGRRYLVGAGLAGLTLPFLSRINAAAALPAGTVIRPPGALPEEHFTRTCVRCGECLKVCIQNALHPVFLEQGLDGMFTPRLIPRLGYCEFNCTLCGQVCPTGAIARLSLAEKQSFVIGRAMIDKNRCLPFAEATPCIVCEEHCPTHDKAIKFTRVRVTDHRGREVDLQQPHVIGELCIGCGICETRCPVAGPAAIRVIPGQAEAWADQGDSYGGYG
ncbi:MAG: 4Fe-4S binding protein [Desulfosudaceae bacterium]